MCQQFYLKKKKYIILNPGLQRCLISFFKMVVQKWILYHPINHGEAWFLSVFLGFFNPTLTRHLFDFQIIVCFQSFLVFYIN